MKNELFKIKSIKKLIKSLVYFIMKRKNPKSIKMLIWDLDDTFWKGTLSEGDIDIVPKNIEIVKMLVNKGIMNSIASKNDFEQAKSKLEGMGIWDYFIFPVIKWSNKSEMISEILSRSKLRADDILFVDDNHLNLKEVSFHFPKINFCSPEQLPVLLKQQMFKGKNDSGQSRLKQYRILEKKEIARKQYLGNDAFLHSCNIKIEILQINEALFERVLELINRTNQLNYTRIRLNAEQLKKLLSNSAYESNCILVQDDYGSYGVVGFYSLDKVKNTLVHFLFSCRILNLGIEQYVYAILNFPKIKAAKDTVVKLNKIDKPDWISECENLDYTEIENQDDNRIRVYMRGGCDIEQMLHYTEDKSKYCFIKNLVKTSPTNHVLRNDHIQVLKNSFELSFKEQQRLAEKLPFYEMSMFDKDIFDQHYDILIFSLLMDYTQILYEEKTTGIKISSYDHFPEVQNIAKHSSILDFFEEIKATGIDETFLNMFKDEFINLGQITASEFEQNLKFIRNNIEKPIIFINSSEIIEFGEEQYKRAIEFNKVLDRFVSFNNNTYILDIRNIVTTREQCRDNARHYYLESYVKMSEEMDKIINKINSVQINPTIVLSK